ncbi:MAG: helix-turn-helix transcriptional regulator [Candidatus Microthrix sp.]|uniref:helix-turn-helix domain-containing protein n=1 Tax=Candidatus Neomicrothrix sp. TaxID=2719034 RepID=UPI0025C4D02C|nr:helix-turn-helix transcriptional regulator [Candidatus Microthrix sp.]MBL0206340.1 helix-turn-helix transcriptional regulator [Candidatus Microthrix sp.]
MDAAEVLHFARRDAELTVRELAERAGVAASTVSRIERRQMDPTVGMLARLIAAAGLELELRSLHHVHEELWRASGRLEVDPDGDDASDWTRLRAVLDYLYLHPTLTQAAIADKPEPSGSALLDNLLAGIAEKISDDAGSAAPILDQGRPGAHSALDLAGTPRMQAVDRS